MLLIGILVTGLVGVAAMGARVSTHVEGRITPSLQHALVYKYTSSGSPNGSFALTAANADPAGITTDGTNLWVLDLADAIAYKYHMAGLSVGSFSLNAANASPGGHHDGHHQHLRRPLDRQRGLRVHPGGCLCAHRIQPGRRQSRLQLHLLGGVAHPTAHFG